MRFKIDNTGTGTGTGADVDSDPRKLQTSRRFNLHNTVGSLLDFIESHEAIAGHMCGAEECTLVVSFAHPKRTITRADAANTLQEFGFVSNTIVWAVVE